MKSNGIKHIHTAPYHPSSNSEAGCFVQTFKHALKLERMINECCTRNSLNSCYFSNISGGPDQTYLDRHWKRELQQSKLSRRANMKWLQGTVMEQTGPVSYRIQVGDRIWRRHVDQMLSNDLKRER